ncbi:hypothetical protein [Actinoplanes sp. NPDC051851]|uniref:hypothetical protein n=1 Tax=Actinoplanes sp. NPDC051851 TaxID=3154753 RepID=UPI003432202A
MSRPRVLRSPLGRALNLFAGTLLVVLPLFGVLVLVASGEPIPAGLAAGLAALLLIGVVLLRLAVVRVVLHDDHVELVNPLRRLRFYWSDVEEIDLISGGGWIVRVWAGGVPRWAWGTSQFGQFGAVPFASVHDDPGKDAPRRVREGYQALRAAWRKHR